jgi:hypothetical protein
MQHGKNMTHASDTLREPRRSLLLDAMAGVTAAKKSFPAQNRKAKGWVTGFLFFGETHAVHQ